MVSDEYKSDVAWTVRPTPAMDGNSDNAKGGKRAKRLSLAQMMVENLASPEDLGEFGHANRNPKDIGFRALVAEDFRTHGRKVLSQGFWALFWHRFGNLRMSVRPKLLRIPLTILYRFGRMMTEMLCGIMLPYTVIVGRRVRLEHFGGMILIARAIGDDVVIRQNTTFGIDYYWDVKPINGPDTDKNQYVLQADLVLKW